MRRELEMDNIITNKYLRKIVLSLLGFMLFFSNITGVTAASLDKPIDDFEPRTYVVGTHEFT